MIFGLKLLLVSDFEKIIQYRLDLSKDVLTVSIGQRTANLWSSVYENDSIPQDINLDLPRVIQLRPSGRIFFRPPPLKACNFAAL